MRGQGRQPRVSEGAEDLHEVVSWRRAGSGRRKSYLGLHRQAKRFWQHLGCRRESSQRQQGSMKFRGVLGPQSRDLGAGS